MYIYIIYIHIELMAGSSQSDIQTNIRSVPLHSAPFRNAIRHIPFRPIPQSKFCSKSLVHKTFIYDRYMEN